ncbi:outer membrane beta-barrel protein [Candidatus Palauibacter sp.]|uniref:outer membrane beta-barrel protein n=1 Tax=Candidatus Palauibacter sp. TaxID=3101350 RepID=UPI003AF252FD
MRPRPRFLAALVVIVCVSPVPALAGQMTVGIHGGLTRAKFSDLNALSDFNETVEGSSRTGVRFGVSATVPVSRSLGLRFEGNYVQAGTGFSVPNLFDFSPSFDHVAPPAATNVGADDRAKALINLDYLRLSAMARAGGPTEGRRVAVYLLAGPFVGFRTACSTSIAASGVSIDVDCDEAESDLSTVDFGVSGGVGVEVGVSSGVRATLEALYDLGLQDLSEGTTNRVFSILAGLVFSL